MVVLPLTCAQPAWGQGQNPPPSPLDSLVAAAPGLRQFSFAPTFTASSQASVTSVALDGKFRHMFQMGPGMRLQTILNARKEEFRLQPRSNENKLFQNTLMQDIGQGWRMELSHMDSRTFNRVVAPTGGFQDVVFNTLTLSAGLRRVSIMPENFRWDGRVMGVLGDAEKTFKTDTSQGAEVGGGFGYNLLDDWLVVRARRYHKSVRVDSRSTLEQIHDLPVYEDSTAATVEVRFSDRQVATVQHDEFRNNEQFTDQDRTSTGVQKIGAENILWEHRTETSRETRVGFKSTMMDALKLDVSAEHSDRESKYEIATTRFSHNVTNRLLGDIEYTLFTGTRVKTELDVSKSLRDLGPQSVSSHNRNTRQLKMSVRHSFDADTYIDINGSTRLDQTFYARDKNPRDQDQLEQRVNVRLSSQPFSKLSATIGATYVQTDFISIDERFSSDNRTKTRYDFRPSITYTVNPRLSIRQNYGLAIEFTDYTYFRFASEDNFLDRNVTFSNEVATTLTSRLSGVFYYGYHFHDRGTYLHEDPEAKTGEQYLDREREDRRDEIEIRFEYRVNEHLALVGKQVYSRKEDRRIGSPIVTVTEDGGIEMGFSGNYNWGTQRTLRVRLMKANYFGPFATEEQKDYWIADAELVYGF